MSTILPEAMTSIIRSIRLRLVDLWEVFLMEFRHIFSDSGAILFFLVVPLVYPFLYSSLYGNETIHEAPLIVVDRSHSALSREYIRRVDATPDVAVVAQVGNEAEAYKLIGEEKGYGVLVIPEDFSRRLMAGQQAEVDLHSTFYAALYYKAYSLATAEVALTMGRELTAQRQDAGSAEATKIAVRPIESEWIAPYNPQGGFQGFLLPGVLVLILQQTLLLGLSMITGTQRERGGLQSPLLRVGGHYVSVMRMLVGRSLCYLVLYAFSSLFVLVIAPHIFGLPQLTDFTTYGVMLLPMLLAMIFFSMFCALLVHHREKSMIIWVFTSVPFLFLSGLSWPLTAIPGPLRALGYLIPSTPGVQAFVAISSMGARLDELMPYWVTLWVQAICYFLLASWTYARLLRHESVSSPKSLP